MQSTLAPRSRKVSASNSRPPSPRKMAIRRPATRSAASSGSASKASESKRSVGAMQPPTPCAARALSVPWPTAAGNRLAGQVPCARQNGKACSTAFGLTKAATAYSARRAAASARGCGSAAGEISSNGKTSGVPPAADMAAASGAACACGRVTTMVRPASGPTTLIRNQA